jgi:hypothetical protein
MIPESEEKLTWLAWQEKDLDGMVLVFLVDMNTADTLAVKEIPREQYYQGTPEDKTKLFPQSEKEGLSEDQ